MLGAPSHCFLFLLYFALKVEENSVNPDQTPRLVASELGLHCLHNTQNGADCLKRVNNRTLVKQLHLSQITADISKSIEYS